MLKSTANNIRNRTVIEWKFAVGVIYSHLHVWKFDEWRRGCHWYHALFQLGAQSGKLGI
jgi:hypothetical protein